MLTAITITGSLERTRPRRSRSFHPERFYAERIARKRRYIDAEETQGEPKDEKESVGSKPIDRCHYHNDTANCRY